MLNLNYVLMAVLADGLDAALSGGAVHCIYNAHYESFIRFETDGTLSVDDEGEKYDIFPETPVRSAMLCWARRVQKVAKVAAMYIPAIPEGNLAEMGGEEAIVKALLLAETAGAYYAESQK